MTRLPLMVLDPSLLPATPDDRALVLDPAAADFGRWYALSAAVADVAFGPAGGDPESGPARRDAEVRPAPPDLLHAVA